MIERTVKLTEEAYQFLKQQAEELDVPMKDVASQFLTDSSQGVSSVKLAAAHPGILCDECRARVSDLKESKRGKKLGESERDWEWLLIVLLVLAYLSQQSSITNLTKDLFRKMPLK